MASAIPSSLGRYEVLEELGKGAMGVVYLARDPLIGRMVALKTFRASQAMHGSELVEYRARFMREAQSAGILSHPHIVTIHDVVDGADGSGVTFIAMEYVRGINLKELLLRGEALPLERVVDVVSQVAEALDYAHSKGVIHRDIKPANIIIDPQGGVKITDFGIARLETSDLTHEGQLLGTPNYMAPERILGHKVDHRTDIFSLGVVLYEMLTRQKPFQGENLTMVSHRIVYEPFVPPRQYAPGLPPGVVAVLEKALEKQPENRYDSAGELTAVLREALTSATANETRVGSRPALTPPPFLPPLPAAAHDEHGAATQDVSGSAAAVRSGTGDGSSGRQRAAAMPPGRRLALISVVAATLALAAAGTAFGWLSLKSPAVGGPDPADRARARYLPLLRQARTDLFAGRPELALAAIASALPIAPNDPHLHRMNERIRRELATRQTVAEQQAQLSALLQSAQIALTVGNPNQAADLLRQVLVLAP
ncbi:MAG TPA: serine/threonine-protein kinase, partial [Thermoanaerobaculia bacterium]|nr:serine/threonine-protein kinase [Thermoanaerobaculia bacterium]